MLLAESLLGSSSTAANYIEDVFSTYLYTGNGSAQTIANNIKLTAGATTPGWFSALTSPTASNRGIAIDASGNIFTAAATGGTVSLLLTKYNSAGVVQWQRTLSDTVGPYNSYGQAVATDSGGNVYIVGDGVVTSSKMMIAKYDTSGTLLWQRAIGSGSGNGAYGVTVDSADNVIVNGYSNNSGTYDIELVKYNSSGTLQWQRRLASSGNDFGYAVGVDSSDNIYISGTAVISTIDSLVVAKYNSSGTLQWQRAWDAANIANGWTGLAVTSAGDVYASAIFTTGYVSLIKYNTSGTLQWQRQIQSPSSYGTYSSVALDGSGNVYLAAQVYKGASAYPSLIAKYNSSGTIQWQRFFETGYTNDSIRGIKADSSGNIYFTGNGAVPFVAKVPSDGTGTGTYTVGSYTYSYYPSSCTLFTPSTAATTSTLTAATTTLTQNTPTYTDASSSASTSSTALTEGAGYDGMVWLKGRSGATDHALYDTVRGATFDLVSNSTATQTTQSTGLAGFTTNGFSIGSLAKLNTNAATYTSWTFRKQAKFFDVVTFTSNASRGATFSHNLGSSPGCVIIKRTDGTENWWVWHRTFTSSQYIVLNAIGTVGSSTPTLTASSTQIVLSDNWLTNANANYVAYIFAHDAGGFGALGTDNVITCGNYTGNGSTTGPVVTLGYEPQWLLIKCTNSLNTDWNIIDNMRGFVVGGADAELNPNAATAETTGTYVTPTATGFQLNTTDTSYNTNNGNYIYIAIRRGPMKTPTTGTSVFSPIASSAATGTTLTTSFPVDAQIFSLRTGTTNKNNTYDRLRGVSSTTTESGARLITSSTAAETAAGNETRLWDNTSFQMPSTFGGASTVFWNFRRAPGFFDVVCYTGTGSATTVSHNLGVAPELMIVKSRSATADWVVYSQALGATFSLKLNSTGSTAILIPSAWNTTTPTSSVFSVGTNTATNGSGTTYVAYLFATVAGVSKVGSYTGTGATLQIDCGFTGGARFVLIKRTDSTGDWYVWDSARGIVAGSDSYLLLNSTAAEVTNTDYIDTYSAGFEISSTAPAAINANGGTFLFMAIA